MQHKKRIPVSENVAYTHWEMPDLTGVKRRIAQRLNELQLEEQAAQQEEDPAKQPLPPTPAEIDAIKKAAQQEGHALGLAAGKQEGQQEGYKLGLQQGQQEGQEAGFQQGYSEGWQQANTEVNQQLQRLQALIEHLQGAVAQLDAETEAALLSLVDLVCRAVLRRDLKLERSHLTQIVQGAVKALPAGNQRIKITVNPEDLNLVEAACQDLLEDYRVYGDAEVVLGGARIETQHSLVDATLASRYQQIIEQLLHQAYADQAAATPPLSADSLTVPGSRVSLTESKPALEAVVNQVPTATLPDEAVFTPEPPVTAPANLTAPVQPLEAQVEEQLAEADNLAIQAEPSAYVAEEPEIPAPTTLVEPVSPLLEAQAALDTNSQPSKNQEAGVTQVSLQRGKAPKHIHDTKPQLNSDPAQPSAPEDELEHEAFMAPEFSVLEAVDVTESADLAEQASSFAPTEEVAAGVDTDLMPLVAADLDVKHPDGFVAAEELETLEDLVDSATIEAADATERPEDLGIPEQLGLAEALADNSSAEEEVTADAAAAALEQDAPVATSVHDDRYLEDVLETTWLDDLHEPATPKGLDPIADDPAR